jgi:KaiC domain protein
MSDEDWFERAVADDEEDVDDEDVEDDDEAADADDGGTVTDVDEGSRPDHESGGGDATQPSAASSNEDLEDRIPQLGEDLGDSLGDEPWTEDDVDPDDVLGDDEGLFEEGFTAALQEAENEGFGSGGADPSAPEFSMGTDAGGGFGDVGVSDLDGELESDISRIDLGIEGLDEMIHGGVPERSLMVAIGSAGTGKTTFGLQFLEGGLSEGERAVFIGLEESRERVIRSAVEKGFPFDEYAEEGNLAVVDLDPVEMANSLKTIRSELPRLIDEFGAERLVLDSVSLLEMMYDHRATRRNEIFDFTKSLKEAGITTMLTSEASQDTAYASRHGIVEYLTDAVFVLQYVRPSDFRETRMAIEIQKIRDANHSREMKPYEITGEGIEVFRQANLF